MTDLQVQYNARKARIKDQLATLKKQLSGHAKGQKTYPANWGYVGDLARVERMLSEILEAI